MDIKKIREQFYSLCLEVEQLRAENARLLRGDCVECVEHIKKLRTEKQHWMATAILLGQAEEVNKQLKTENGRLKEIQTKWKCAGCDEIVYRHDYCARCRRQWES